MKKYILVILIIYIFNMLLFSNAKVYNVFSESKLSDNSINSIIQDRNGFLWFGTESGLNRFDGYNFKVYKNIPNDNNSISFNRISVLFLDREGKIWIGTRGSGLCLYREYRDDFIRFNFTRNDAGHKFNTIYSISQDRKGMLWVGTMGGIIKFDPATSLSIVFKFPEQMGYNLNFSGQCMLIESSGDLLLGTNSGLFRLNYKKNFKPINFEPNINVSNESKNILSVFKDRKGKILIGTNRGVFKLSRDEKHIVSFTERWAKEIGKARVYSFVNDRHGRLWIASWNGLFMLDKDHIGFEKFSNSSKTGIRISSDLVLSLFIDKTNVLWVGTIKGLNKLNTDICGFNNYDIRNILKRDVTSIYYTAVYEDINGDLWLGTLKNGIIKYNRNRNEVKNFFINGSNSDIFDNMISFIGGEGTEDIFIGTGNGVFIFNKRKENFSPLIDFNKRKKKKNIGQVLSVFKYNKNEFFLGTTKGFFISNKRNNSIKRIFMDIRNNNRVNSELITSILEDRKGKIWVTSYGGGLHRFYPQKNSFKKIDIKLGKNSRADYLYPVIESSDGKLWMGSNEGGLICYNPGNRTSNNYLLSDGLSSNTVWSVEEDDLGNLWMNTSNGISKFDVSNRTFVNYSENHGINSISF